MEKEVKDFSQILYRKLKKVSLTREDVNLVMNVLEVGECEPAKGELADAVVKTLMDKYYPYFKKKYSKLELANLFYAILTEELCEVCYGVAVAAKLAEEKYEQHMKKYPIEFFISESIKVLNTLPNGWDIYADEEDSDATTVKESIEGVLRRELFFPTPENKVLAYPDSPVNLIYVTDSQRWLAVCSVDIAGFIGQYSNPVINTPKGLMQGEVLLRTLGGLCGVVTDDFILVR